ncbi:putative (3S,6E)-nerolidol synthase [Medicago truncatula]|uniref:(3S)-linalool/(E)-nerolidol/(E,E)-geranyl linalool synthase n=1 Tax=Medicago truncatula TaxID=3880 RepID=Q5UB06_MEDTR|nr:(3S,6E)-nerolidol synthase 1 [Medicago truncatula]AAV36466.1 wound-inducible putative chloroplast terpene synthase 3 [Medicago truncatula]KEH31174.1 (3S)-linalool/(E)-nerolidol/(E,E)-geranyl linalool synthase [Medicago truncatula]RHN62573.1 putative (3S,6E)-nerolidol synthase [Medicago truncatula]
MAFSLSFATSTKHSTFSSNKTSNILEYNKTNLTSVFNQIHIPKSGKCKDDLHIRHAKALDEVKQVFVRNIRKNTDECLSMVDSIQRLGMEYNFEEEIEATLERKHTMLRFQNFQRNEYQGLSQAAFQFRMLRQEGYYISPDIFDKFCDNKGKLKYTFSEDINGMIALFEASQLSIEGEDCLDNVGQFCGQYLNDWSSTFHGHPQAKFVAHTLMYPTHKTLSRFTPTIMQSQNATWTNSIQQFSKIDTQMVSSSHLKEIFAVSKWWKDLGLPKDLEFARDEPIKWYSWSMACLPDPQFSEERIELTKPLSLIYIIDDIFDFYGNIDELTLFTDAVKRWDLSAIEQLPDCMKVCFKALYDITNEFALRTYIKHGWNPLTSLIKSWVRLLNAFLQEAKWFASGNVPKSEEYLKNAIVSTGVHVILVHAFFCMGQGITEKTVSLMDDFPTIISTTAKILRLCDDLEGDKDVNCEGNDGSYSKCYMKDNPGVSIGLTKEHMSEQISDAWKQLNKECLNTNPLPSSFTKLCLNAARMVPIMYNYDGNTPSKLEEYVKSLLNDGGYLQSIHSPTSEHSTV